MEIAPVKRILPISTLIVLGLLLVAFLVPRAVDTTIPLQATEDPQYCGRGHENHHTGHITRRIEYAKGRRVQLTTRIRRLERRADRVKWGSDRYYDIRDRIRHLREKRATVINRIVALKDYRAEHHDAHHDPCRREPTPAPTVTVTSSPTPAPTVTVTESPPPECGGYGEPPCP